MKLPTLQRRTLALAAVVVPMLVLFVYVALRSGPLAPVAVTVATVESRPITPSLFGIGTVQARYTYRIGPTVPGRVKHLQVHVGEQVKAGQVLGEMDPVDLDQRIKAQQAGIKSADAALRQAEVREGFAQTQASRYEQLLAVRGVSEETVAIKRQDLAVARAALAAVREDGARLRAELQAMHAQRGNLRLVTPVDGLVASRDADPGTTVVAGQSVIEVVEPGSVWVNVRFDQQRARGLQAGLAARIVLRSQTGEPIAGLVSRVEPYADAVTEETLAKIEFKQAPASLPPLGELAEVTVALQSHKAMPVVPNASVQRVDGKLGVWVVDGNSLRFAPVTLGVADLEGRTQVLQGLRGGERVVSYSHKTLSANSRFTVVDQIAGKAS